jgi:hypothetical protein
MLNELVSSAKAVAGNMARANAVHIRARSDENVLRVLREVRVETQYFASE